MRYRKKWLDVPGLSQGNTVNAVTSQSWCGRAASSMVYNYFQLVAGGGEQAYIRNNESSAPYDLIYPDGTLAASSYQLLEPLNKVVAGWTEKPLYPLEARSGGEPTDDAMLRILEPAFRKPERNSPIMFSSGISMGKVLADGTIGLTR